MKTLQELRAEGASLFHEAEPLLAKSEDSAATLTEDERRKLGELRDKLIANTKEIKDAEAHEATLRDLRGMGDYFTQPVGGAAAGKTPRGDDGAPRVDLRSLGRRFVTSEAYRAYRKEIRGNSGKVPLHSFWRAGVTDDTLPPEGLTPEEARAVVYTNPANLPGPPMRVPGIFAPNQRPLRIRDLVINGTTTSNSIDFVQESSFTNAAAETAEATATSNGLKPESALGFSVVSAAVKTIATFIPVTRQMIEDAPQMETYVNTRLQYFVALREDDELMKGDGTGANLTGILNTSGIQTLDDAYFAANPLPTVGSAANNIDRIRRARTKVRVTGRAIPDAIVLHPDDYEKFDEMKDSQGHYLLENPQADDDTNESLWGLRVVESEAVNAGAPVVGAFGTMAAIWDRQQSNLLMTDSHSDWFARNLLALLAEERLAFTVYRPSAFAVVTLD